MIVYTAIFGTTNCADVLRPVPGEPGVDYHAFVDDITEPRRDPTGWLLRPSFWPRAGSAKERNLRRQARQHKLLSHEIYPGEAVTLWMDGNFTPRGSMLELARNLTKHDMQIFKHRERRCTYKEIEACMRLRKDDRTILSTLMARYKREGMPANLGLPETGVLLRKHTPAVIAFNTAWWQELSQYSIRDQVSVQYVCWKLGMTYESFPGTFDTWPYCHYKPHKYKPQR